MPIALASDYISAPAPSFPRPTCLQSSFNLQCLDSCHHLKVASLDHTAKNSRLSFAQILWICNPSFVPKPSESFVILLPAPRPILQSICESPPTHLVAPVGPSKQALNMNCHSVKGSAHPFTFFPDFPNLALFLLFLIVLILNSCFWTNSPTGFDLPFLTSALFPQRCLPFVLLFFHFCPHFWVLETLLEVSDCWRKKYSLFLLDIHGLAYLLQHYVECLLCATRATRGYKTQSPRGCSIISMRYG